MPDLPFCSLDNAGRFGQSALVEDFPGYLRERVVDGLRSLVVAQRDDTYVVSFFVYDEQDDPRLPTLTVGTNTESQVRLHDDEGDDLEVRWNYAYWQQDELSVVGAEATDPVGVQLRRSWLDSQGLWFEDDTDTPFAALCFDDKIKWYSTPRADTVNPTAPVSDADDLSPESDAAGGRITKNFVELCVRTAQELHASGLIEKLFGRPIPIVVHELEYYDEIAQQNIEANGPELASGLVEWISSMYDEIGDDL